MTKEKKEYNELSNISVRNLRSDNSDLSQFISLLKHLSVIDITVSRAKLIYSEKIASGDLVAVVCLNDKIVGTATLLIEAKFIHNARVGRIEDVCVLPEFRKKGIATLLIDELCQTAKSKNCYKVLLDCKDEIKKVYEKSGFYQHEVTMRKNLV